MKHMLFALVATTAVIAGQAQPSHAAHRSSYGGRSVQTAYANRSVHYNYAGRVSYNSYRTVNQGYTNRTYRVSNYSTGYGNRYANYNLTYGTRFAQGYYYSGRNHNHWSYCRYDARYGCNCYYDPCCSSWYYWCEPASCYYPVTYCPYRTYCWPTEVAQPVYVQSQPTYVQPQQPTYVQPQQPTYAQPQQPTYAAATADVCTAAAGPADAHATSGDHQLCPAALLPLYSPVTQPVQTASNPVTTTSSYPTSRVDELHACRPATSKRAATPPPRNRLSRTRTSKA